MLRMKYYRMFDDALGENSIPIIRALYATKNKIMSKVLSVARTLPPSPP